MNWLLALGAVALIVWGDDLLKQAAERREIFSSTVFVAGVLYAAGAPAWAYLLQGRSLTQIAVLYTTFVLLGLMALDWWRYTPPSTGQFVAAGMALAAVVVSELS